MSVIETINKQDYYLIAEIGVNYYDIATKLGISNMEAAKLMVRQVGSLPLASMYSRKLGIFLARHLEVEFREMLMSS